LVSHIEEMLQTAYNKLHSWQSRRLMKKTWSVYGFVRLRKPWSAVTLETWPDRLAGAHKGETSAACQLPELMLLYLHIENWREGRDRDSTKCWGGKLRQNQNELSCKYICIYMYIYMCTYICI
jgi:hypothetical protein